MEYIVENVPYVAQEKAETCWKAAYKMMLKYKGRPESLAESLPNDAEMKVRGILDREFLSCRNKVGLTSSTYKAFLTLADIKLKLETYGPIWVSGDYCEGIFKHIVVVRRVRSPTIGEDEVCINDPCSGFKGAPSKPRWIPLQRFVSKLNRVDFACQHWM